MLNKLASVWRGRRDAAPAAAPAAAAARPVDWIAEGNAHLHAGRVQEAAGCYEEATRASPADPSAWLNLGYAKLELGDVAHARESLQSAVRTASNEQQLAEANYFLARAWRAAGAQDEALACYEAAIAARPAFVHALHEMADWLLALGRPADAERWIAQARRAEPGVAADVLLARALYDQKRFAEVLPLLDAVVAQEPQHVDAREGRGAALMALDRPAEAVADFQAALASGGETALRLVNLAAAHYQLGQGAQAEPLLLRALAMEPTSVEAANNLAMVRLDQLLVDEAVSLAQQALDAHPGDPDLLWTLGRAKLLQGNYAEGWPGYEARWKTRWATPAPPRHLRFPAWDGSPLAGRKLLVTQEQGFGDLIQMLRFVPRLASEASEVLLDVPDAIKPLLWNAPPNVRCVSLDEAKPDVACPVMSLPLRLGVRLDDLPGPAPYLAPEPAVREQWAPRLKPDGRLRVGLAWSGNPQQSNDRNRSMPLEVLRALDMPGVEFFSLLPVVRDTDRPAMEAWSGLRRLGESFRNFGDTAAALQEMDLVISVCTSVAHLAGALGRPLWVLLAHHADWRWHLHRSDSPWYPSARLYRQPAPGDWGSVVAEVRAQLQALVPPDAAGVNDATTTKRDAEEPAADVLARGEAMESRGAVLAAMDLYRRAAAQASDAQTALRSGIHLASRGDDQGAGEAFRRGLEMEPGNATLALHAALLAKRLGDPAAFHAAAQRAADAPEATANAFLLLSQAHSESGDTLAALAAVDRALALEPGRPDLHVNQFQLLKKLGRQKEALAAVDAAIMHGLDDPDLLTNVYAAGGYCEETIAASKRAASAQPGALMKRSAALFYGNFDENASAQALFEAHAKLGEHLEGSVQPVYQDAWLPAADPDRVLRIGFVSSDLSQHPVTLFLLALLSHLDRARFEVHCYNCTVRRDAATEAVQRVSDGWVEAQKLTDAQLAQRIHADGIDILVDLAGHSSTPRVGTFAFRPAPVQVGWLGYLNTTGLRRMDFRLCDRRTDPPQTQRFHTEELWHLPRSQWCYRPFIDVPHAAVAPFARRGHLTFGSMNNGIKVSYAMVRRWAQLVNRVPGSRVVMASIGSERRRQAIRDIFREEGVEPGRIEFPPHVDLENYYKLYDLVDIALDSYPYGGGTTTLDALWMGVPVIATTGELPVARSAASILSWLGMDEWVAPSLEAYVDLAVARAQDLLAIQRLRQTLRARLQASPLMDQAGFASDFGDAMRGMWQRHCQARSEGKSAS